MFARHRSKIALALGLIAVLLVGVSLGLALATALSARGKKLAVDFSTISMPAVSDPHWRFWLQHKKIKVSAVVFYGR